MRRRGRDDWRLGGMAKPSMEAEAEDDGSATRRTRYKKDAN